MRDAKKVRIIRFLHTYSHSDGIGEPEFDPSGLSEALGVLNNILEFIQPQDHEHFKAMEKLVLAKTSDKGETE